MDPSTKRQSKRDSAKKAKEALLEKKLSCPAKPGKK